MKANLVTGLKTCDHLCIWQKLYYLAYKGKEVLPAWRLYLQPFTDIEFGGTTAL